jgi:hypothetical protein
MRCANPDFNSSGRQQVYLALSRLVETTLPIVVFHIRNFQFAAALDSDTIVQSLNASLAVAISVTERSDPLDSYTCVSFSWSVVELSQALIPTTTPRAPEALHGAFHRASRANKPRATMLLSWLFDVLS